MGLDLFAGISVRDFQAALRWYERLLGAAPSFFPNDVEAVWELAENRWLYVEHRPAHAGHALITVIVDDLEERVAGIARRGLTPASDETYENGVRKVTYRDPEGNEVGFGGTPNPGEPAS
ncbi:VOC family protein [Asanoa sp. NPDC050611]|uniref:VOC family protein n=1 Tax=Asanoa sp. NPDC050611 TaxID=3157098 RepID=UPI0033E2883A